MRYIVTMLRNLSVELNNLIQEENYEILALNYILILYYHEKENIILYHSYQIYLMGIIL